MRVDVIKERCKQEADKEMKSVLNAARSRIMNKAKKPAAGDSKGEL